MPQSPYSDVVADLFADLCALGRSSRAGAIAATAALVLVAPAGNRHAEAHPGGTDEEGCHTCHTDCEKWDETAGEEHCHDGGDEEGESEGTSDGGDEESEEVPLEEGAEVYVDKVLDGDTLVVRPTEGSSDRLRIRILGIDCPESHENPKCRRQGRRGGPSCEEQIPRGLKAAKKVAELIKHQVVEVESEEGDGEFERGGYDRVLAYIRLKDGRDLGKFLVEKGLCRDYGEKYPHPRHEEYESAAGE